MVVWQSKYDRVVRELNSMAHAASVLTRELRLAKNNYNRIFRKYQEANDEIARLSNNTQNNSGFTQEELKAIRRVMHPDRNQGSAMSTQITQKINGMLK